MEPVVKKTFLVSYDLNDAEPEVYENLFDYFESFGSWARITESLWAVRTEKTAIEIRNLSIKGDPSQIEGKDSNDKVSKYSIDDVIIYISYTARKGKEGAK